MDSKNGWLTPKNNMSLKRLLKCTLALLLFLPILGLAESSGYQHIQNLLANHAPRTGVYILDKGQDALIARAWLADNAQESINVQYFIWSNDNVGILAAESLLRAAERGVKVNVIIDDLLIDSPSKALIALSRHPNISIRIYNPQHTVGTSIPKRIYNIITNFRGANQRMHDKTFIVDNRIAIVGGRNMADEYFDFDKKYNFRDREVLLLGDIAKDINKSFSRFSNHELSVPVEEIFADKKLFKHNVTVKADEVQDIYQFLHEYALSPENLEPEIKQLIDNLAENFDEIAENLVWTDASFISDKPGKNDNSFSLLGGGQSTSQLAQLIKNAKESIVIQTPYLVLDADSFDVFQEAVSRGVKITISTNSMASTDNLLAFSGYKDQRQTLLSLGINIYEYKPHPEIQQHLMTRHGKIKDKQPIFAIHAKSMVIDSKQVFIGTFNLDPRSQHLNTEVGVIIHNRKIAAIVEQAIQLDMLPANSWNAANTPDKYASRGKRIKAFFLQLLPLEPLL